MENADEIAHLKAQIKKLEIEKEDEGRAQEANMAAFLDEIEKGELRKMEEMKKGSCLASSRMLSRSRRT